MQAPSAGFDPFSAEADACGARIAASGARLCFVCLGAPKQELFADRMTQKCPGVGFMCVGAALDFIADAQVRAPLLLRKTGFEWIWRVLSHPRRLAWRYVHCAAVLTDIVLIEPMAHLQRHRSQFGQ